MMMNDVEFCYLKTSSAPFYTMVTPYRPVQGYACIAVQGNHMRGSKMAET